MCEILVINRGEKEIETPRQFQEHFGFLPHVHNKYNESDLDMCLCSCDLDETFEQKGIEYARSTGSYYVGDLIDLEIFDYHFKPIVKIGPLSTFDLKVII
jgi:hypothetical protein